MKVQLIVVQGRPEGKVIPLVGPKFKIGRGETCHLRPNSEQVSREHAEFSLTGDVVAVSDLGSRNGTLVNGKAITEQCTLKDRDLVQVGPLTFAVSIQGAPVAADKPAPAASQKTAPEDVNNDDIESWLIADSKNAAPERPSGVYGGDTITINAFKDAAANPKPKGKAEPVPAPVEEDSDDEYERQPEGDDEDDTPDATDEAEATDEMPEEFIDESNPFYVKKKGPEPAKGAPKPEANTSDAASEILRKMIERKRSSR
jgi:predicted component of type VI protein secretion system